ncbi:MAG: hypothetical protein C3F12_10320, partial [Candidatus Methylomirabilota bacterium]
MRTLEYKVTFTTPAFLGNAEQQAQWRTPPFKALLRQWWRVAAARDCAFNHARLREAEARLFGAANDKGGESQKSQVRLRLDIWAQGTLQGIWGNDPRVDHPEVGPNGREVGAHLYLGYGPLRYQQGTALKANVAIQSGESARLRLVWPDDETAVADAIQLMQWFGSLGGRSRNGWGSISLEHASITAVIPAQAGIQNGLLGRVSRPLRECLELDWPHALGRSADNHLLVWRSKETFSDWRAAMQALAKVKIGFRTQLKLGAQGPFERRHLLAYPVTNHAVQAWGNQSRLANQLRFKVTPNAKGRVMALIYHLPCGLPRPLAQELRVQAPSVKDHDLPPVAR